MTPDCYVTLGIFPTADRATVTSAYRRLCKLYHPDINRAPGAEDKMKAINAAYHILKDERRRQEYDLNRSARPPHYDAPKGPFGTPPPRREEAPKREEPPHRPEVEAPAKVMGRYLGYLREGAHERAYNLLCLYDRQYVTLPSFCQWRKSVERLFAMRDFQIIREESVDSFPMDEHSFAPARKLHISITEKSFATGAVEGYPFIKHVVMEYGQWRVFLGYRDLSEIARMFEDLKSQQEQGELAKRWEAYCRNTCRGLDMLSLEGLLHEASREIYRCRRYGQIMTVGLFSVAPTGRALPLPEESLGDVVDMCARSLTEALRETDIPAYLGGGVFAVLFVEMRRRSAPAILARLAQGMARAVQKESGRMLAPRFVQAAFEGGSLEAAVEKLKGDL